MRIFISINIPDQIKKEIIKIQNKLPEFYGKKTESENLHLTLKFLGEINENKIEQVKKKLNEIKYNSFEAEIDSLGIFDNRNSKIYKKRIVIWLHLTNCNRLQKIIDNSLKDLFNPEKRFMSHLTIARVKNLKDNKKFLEELNKIKIQPIKFDVNSFSLRKSVLTRQYPIYETIEQYNLKERI